MPNRTSLIRASRVRALNSGRVRDVFLFLLLWYAVRFAANAAVHYAAPALLPPGLLSLRFHLAFTTRSLVGLIFSIWFFKMFCRRRETGFFERFGLERPMDFADPAFLKSLGLFLLIFAVPNIARYVFSTWPSGTAVGSGSPSAYTLTAIRVVALSPLAEELIWRGFAYPIFKESYGLMKGIVITSLLFALPHMPLIVRYPFPSALLTFAYFFLVGAGLTIMFERGSNLKWCILSHAWLNLTLFAVDVIYRELVWG